VLYRLSLGLGDGTRISSDQMVMKKAAVFLSAEEYTHRRLYQYPQCSGIKLTLP